jgi:hypothetical protein
LQPQSSTKDRVPRPTATPLFLGEGAQRRSACSSSPATGLITQNGELTKQRTYHFDCVVVWLVAKHEVGCRRFDNRSSWATTLRRRSASTVRRAARPLQRTPASSANCRTQRSLRVGMASARACAPVQEFLPQTNIIQDGECCVSARGRLGLVHPGPCCCGLRTRGGRHLRHGAARWQLPVDGTALLTLMTGGAEKTSAPQRHNQEHYTPIRRRGARYNDGVGSFLPRRYMFKLCLFHAVR